MLILSHYTETGNYPALAAQLRESCEKWGLRYAIEPVPDRGSWLKNVQHKPNWIIDALIAMRESILWLDADSVVRAPPSMLFGTPVDFACFNWNADPDVRLGAPSLLRATGATLYFAYSAPALELLLRWARRVHEQPYPIGTDPSLDDAYNLDRPPLRTLWLPKSYCRFDKQWSDVPPVIDHIYREREHSPIPSMFHFADVYDEAVDEAADGASFVEVGCWLGESSSHMARRIKDSGKSIEFYCIDTWKGSNGVGWMMPIVKRYGGDLFPAWLERMRKDGVAEHAIPMQQPSVQAAREFGAASLDFVFIDGDHAYEEVLKDIDAWLPKVKPGGLLAGDDYDQSSHPGVVKAVDGRFGDRIERKGRSWLFRV